MRITAKNDNRDVGQPSTQSIPQLSRKSRSSSYRAPILDLEKSFEGIANMAKRKRGKISANYLDDTKLAVAQDKSQESALPDLPNLQVKPESDYNDETVEFQGLARLPRRHASLLEKECINRPDLAKCPGRSARWWQFVCETMGELLFFLRSTRHRDMTAEKRAMLRQLWEEARGMGLDLYWLEPQVNFALDSGPYLEDQRASIAALEAEQRRLDEAHDTLRCQLATLTMLMCENKRDRAALGLQVQLLKDRVKSLDEAFLY